MKRLLIVLLGLVTVLALTLPASAQSKATINGTVKDATGAVIAGANITITNQQSGDQRKTVTNKEGFFSAPLLPVGTYKLNASAKGFAKYEAKDIELNTMDSKTVNIALPLETVTEKVEVSAMTSEVAVLDSGEKSDTITSQDLADIAIASRNAVEYVKIMGGAALTANAGVNKPNSTSYVGINGYTPQGNAAGLGGVQVNQQNVDITMDGGHIFDPGAYGSATPVNPNADMVSEVKVLSSNFSAESEKGPVVVNVTSKHGGKDFHGEAYLYIRPTAMMANDANNKQSKLPRPEGKSFYPGGQIGGPVLIPGTGFNKNRDKMFFHTSYEYYGQSIPTNPLRAQVPTDGMLAGNFSAAEIAKMQGTNPLGLWNGTNQVASYGGGQPWSGKRPDCVVTGGILSAGCMDPSGDGLKLLRAYLPRPNVDPTTHNGYNYVAIPVADMNMWQSHSVLDINMSDNTKLFLRADESRNTANQPLGLWGGAGGDMVVPAASNVVGQYKTDSYSASLTHVFSPTMTMESTFAYTFEGMPNTPSDYSKISRKGLGLVNRNVYGDGMAPAFTAWGSGFPNIGQGNGVGESFVEGGASGSIANKGMPSWKNDLTKVIGTHSLKFGVFWEHVYNKQDNWGTYQGVFQLPQGWGTGVGNNYADILMGITPGGYGEAQRPPATGILQTVVETFAQDHWKVHPRVTIDYGMRFDHIGKPYSSTNLGLAVFNPINYNDNPALLDSHPGVSWHGMDPSVPLSGAKGRFLFYSPRFGMAWDLFGNNDTVLRGGWGLFRAYDSLQSGSYVGPVQTAMGAGGYSCDAWSCPTFEDIASHAINHPLPAGLPPGLQNIAVTDPNNNNQPVVTSYSLTIDQKLPKSFMLELSYVGNNTAKLQPQIDINAVPVGSVSPAAYVAQLNTSAGWTDANTTALRPRHNYKSITSAVTSGKQQYDSFQAALRRSMGWLTLQANYTWAKAFGPTMALAGNYNVGGFADYGEKEYFGIDPNIRPQTFSTSYVINVPKFKGGNAFVRGLTNGWQISGITQITSGANLFAQNASLNYGRDQLKHHDDVLNKDIVDADYSNWGMMGSNGVEMHAKIICNPNMNQSMGSAGVRYLNPACFAPADPGTAGTTNSPYLAGPRFWNSDLTVTKSFRLTERQNVQFRLAAFNFMNHSLWSFGNNDPLLNLKFNADGTLKNANNFGVATQKFGHREVELMVKYSF